MRVFILVTLSLFLGILLFLKGELEEAKQASNEIQVHYFTQEYVITKMTEDRCYGKAADDKEIFFKKELVQLPSGSKLKVDDRVIVYFENGKRTDGVLKVEKEN